MSAATIDRLLRAPRNATRSKRARRTAPEPRRRGPLRTFADWNEPLPGSMEMDTVAHCGDANRGSYISSVVLTDVASGWTEAAPLVVRDGTLVVETLERIRLGLPYALRALDVDNVLTAESSPVTDAKAPGERHWSVARCHLPQRNAAPSGLPRRGDPRLPSLTQGPPSSDGLHRT